MTKGFIRLVGPTMKNCFPANKVQNYFIKSAHLLDLHILHCVVLNKTIWNDMLQTKQTNKGYLGGSKGRNWQYKIKFDSVQAKNFKNCNPLGIQKKI